MLSGAETMANATARLLCETFVKSGLSKAILEELPSLSYTFKPGPFELGK